MTKRYYVRKHSRRRNTWMVIDRASRHCIALYRSLQMAQITATTKNLLTKTA